MSSGKINQSLMDELEAVASDHDCELVHAEFRGGVLRLILDRPGGITLDHCERVSRDVSPLLDTEDFGGGRYLLEVSSPGLDRELYRPRDWQMFVGRALKVTFRDEEGKKKTIHGRLQGFEPAAGGTAQVLERDAGELVTIPLERVQRAKLEIEL